jgi:aspartyl-tRNA synthetase
MDRILASKLHEDVGKRVLVKGWMDDVPSLGKLDFAILRDPSGFLQIVI